MMNTLTKTYNFILLPGLDGTGNAYIWLKKYMLDSGVQPENIYVIPYEDEHSYEALNLKIRSIITNSSLPIFIIAESFAGPLALSLASENPDKVKKVVLSASFGIKPSCNFIHPLGLSLFNIFPKSLIPVNKIPNIFLHELLLGKYATPDIKLTMEEIFLNAKQDIFDKRIKSVVSLPNKWDKQWKNIIHTDVLIIKASKDRLLNRLNSNILKENLPKSFLIELEGPHLLLQTNAREAWGHIVRFEQI
jgi:pimeloyl-[acyl-carrier protein] methyl ester esterase